ncbi:MAG: DMT family transporter [Rhodobacterales bacterium]|nr:DMT family transporter [Rhodobacterales bacterium]
MTTDRHTRRATAIVVATGVFWGFCWLPVRTFTVLGLAGAWGTVAITLAAVLLLIPFAVTYRRQIASAGPVALASIALGGAAFALYSIGFVYGRVAFIILLWFLTPVWSTLIGRFIMGWPTPRLRIVAIAVGIVGLFIMLGANGELPLPHGIGEWMAVVAGLLWSVSTSGIRARSTLAPVPAAFIFARGALVAAVAPVLIPPPDTFPAPLLAMRQ